MNNITILLLSAGEGRRIRELTSFKPKCMLPVLARNKHLLEYWRHCFVDIFGFSHVVVNTWHLKQKIKMYARNKQDVKIFDESFLYPQGMAIAEVFGMEKTDKMIVVNSDTFIPEQEIQKFLIMIKNNENNVIGIEKINDVSKKGVIEILGNDVISFREKPNAIKTGYVAAGIYYIHREKIFKINNIVEHDLHYILERTHLNYVKITGHIDIGGSIKEYEAAKKMLNNVRI